MFWAAGWRGSTSSHNLELSGVEEKGRKERIDGEDLVEIKEIRREIWELNEIFYSEGKGAIFFLKEASATFSTEEIRW